jgi:hypothetical protein
VILVFLSAHAATLQGSDGREKRTPCGSLSCCSPMQLLCDELYRQLCWLDLWLHHLCWAQVTVLSAGTGSGKTTQVIQYLFEDFCLQVRPGKP